MNLKNTIFILVIVAFLSQIIMLNQGKNEQQNGLKKPTIALSTFPLYDIAKNIAKTKIDVYMILPIGVDVHSFEPNPKQIIKLLKSDRVIYSGASLEPWISRLNIQDKAVDMSHYVDLIEMGEHHHSGHTHADEHSDPHYWLSLANMKKATQKITQEMIALDEKNQDFYLANEALYLKMLEQLDKDYQSSLSHCKQNEILTNHNAFSYLANAYNFHVHSLSEFSPDAQTNAKNMIYLIKKIKDEGIATIFYESFASTKAMRTIAKESGVKVEVLQPLANITADEKDLSYEDIMRQNLAKLQEAMECQ